MRKVVLFFLLSSMVYQSDAQIVEGVKIGFQVWMTENLNSERFQNGEKIIHAQSIEDWVNANNSHQPAWCYYNGIEMPNRGKLYNWHAISDNRNLCPSGWRLPKLYEWREIESFYPYDPWAEMKTANVWEFCETNSFPHPKIKSGNLTGFSALPTGTRNFDGTFNNDQNSVTRWWTWNNDPEFYDIHSCYSVFEVNMGDDEYRTFVDSGMGFSVRCIQTNSLNDQLDSLVFEGSPISTVFVPLDSLEIPPYRSVKIGSQVWMVDNLDVSYFRNGDKIPHAESVEDWIEAAERKQPAWCYTENDPVFGKMHGKLYNWYAVNDPRGLSPKGWHIPSISEWNLLENNIIGKDSVGIKMKRKSGWTQGDCNNESGFSAMPGGYRDNKGQFFDRDSFASWWTSTELSKSFSYSCNLLDENGKLNSAASDFGNGFFVRCIQDKIRIAK